MKPARLTGGDELVSESDSRTAHQPAENVKSLEKENQNGRETYDSRAVE
jgi:hypothetical protein